MLARSRISRTQRSFEEAGVDEARAPAERQRGEVPALGSTPKRSGPEGGAWPRRGTSRGHRSPSAAPPNAGVIRRWDCAARAAQRRRPRREERGTSDELGAAWIRLGEHLGPREQCSSGASCLVRCPVGRPWDGTPPCSGAPSRRPRRPAGAGRRGCRPPAATVDVRRDGAARSRVHRTSGESSSIRSVDRFRAAGDRGQQPAGQRGRAQGRTTPRRSSPRSRATRSARRPSSTASSASRGPRPTGRRCARSTSRARASAPGAARPRSTPGGVKDGYNVEVPRESVLLGLLSRCSRSR